MKITLSEQIIEAELHRDELVAASADITRINRAEANVLSLRFLQTYEQGFRDTFERSRPSNQREGE
jgi:hypothetical protein